MLKNYIAIVKEVKKSFLYNFGLFSAVSAPVYLLSVTLQSHYFHVLRTALWLKMWLKIPPAFYRLTQSQ